MVLPVPVAPAIRPSRFIIRSGTSSWASVTSDPSCIPRPRSTAAPSVAWASFIVAAKSLIGRGIVSPGGSVPQASKTSSGSAAETSAFGASTSSETRSSAATLIST